MKNLFESIKAGTLIGKYLTGKESAKEAKQLKDWVEQDNTTKELFDSIKDEKKLANSIKEFDQFETEAAWEKYNESISIQSKKILYFRWKVAASIIIITVLSSVTLLNYFSEKELETIEIAQQILPGEPKAYIELGNGAKFDLQNLNQQQQNKLEEDAGIVVDGNTVISLTATDSKEQPKILTLVTPRGGEYKMILDDGTEVWLNADSRLEFPDKFAANKRQVKLSGEAYFNVTKESERPFIVNLNNIDIEVLGTEFNISAYKNDDQIKTTLVEGKVSVKNNSEIETKQKILSPGEQASFDINNGAIEIKQVDVYQYIAWKEGRFVFELQTLGEIAKVLERWYDVDFVFASSDLKDIPFSGEFLRYDDIEKVYVIIKKTGTQLQFKQTDRTIEISN